MPLVSRWGSEVLTTGAFEPDTNKPRPITLGLGSKPVPIDLLGKTDVLGTFVERTRVSSRGSWVERPRPLKGRGSSGGDTGDTGDTGGGAVAPLAGPSGLTAEEVVPENPDMGQDVGHGTVTDQSPYFDPDFTSRSLYYIGSAGDTFELSFKAYDPQQQDITPFTQNLKSSIGHLTWFGHAPNGGYKTSVNHGTYSQITIGGTVPSGFDDYEYKILLGDPNSNWASHNIILRKGTDWAPRTKYYDLPSFLDDRYVSWQYKVGGSLHGTGQTAALANNISPIILSIDDYSSRGLSNSFTNNWHWLDDAVDTSFAYPDPGYGSQTSNSEHTFFTHDIGEKGAGVTSQLSFLVVAGKTPDVTTYCDILDARTDREYSGFTTTNMVTRKEGSLSYATETISNNLVDIPGLVESDIQANSVVLEYTPEAIGPFSFISRIHDGASRILTLNITGTAV